MKQRVRLLYYFNMLLGACLLFPACTKIDDYMFGKDNTPKPSELKEIKPKLNLVEDWSVPVGKATKIQHALKLKPVLQGNRLYTAEPGGMVQALNSKNAKPFWSKNINRGILSGPTVAEGRIAVTTNGAGVVLFNQIDGRELWKVHVSSDVLAKPVISKDRLIVKTIDGHVYALKLSDGETLWVVDHGAPHLILKASSSPVVMGQVVLVGFSDGKLDAIDLQTGAVVWQRSIAYASGASDIERLVDIDADPIVRGNVVYLASYQGYVGALSLKNGEFLWRKPASTYKNIALDGHTLYMTDSNDVIWAFDRQNGHVKWKQPALKARGLSEPVLMGNRMIIADKTGYLHVLSTRHGGFLARTDLNVPVTVAPTVSGHQIYVMGSNGRLNRFSVS